MNKNNSRWHFWFNIAFTFFLVMLFVYYLPLRFVYENEMGEMMHQMANGTMMMGEGEMKMMDDHGEHGLTMLHEETAVTSGIVSNLNVTPVPVKIDTPTKLDFFVNVKPEGSPITIETLKVVHEKVMHVIGVRSDMNEFFHIHPEPSGEPEFLTVNHTFLKPGTYKLWSELTNTEATHVFGHPTISVAGAGPLGEKQVSFARNVIIGDYQVALDVPESIAKNSETDLSFDIHTLVGDEVELENYLGAKMHLSIIKDDLTEFIHTHPEEMAMDHMGSVELIARALAHGGVPDEAGTENTDAHGTGHGLNFHAAFPKAGLYKAFAQFRPQGVDLPPDEALLASFWIKVGDSKPPLSIASNKLGLALISLVLMGLLSWGVKKYLTVQK